MSVAVPSPVNTSPCHGLVTDASVMRTGSVSSAMRIRRPGTHCGRAMVPVRHTKPATAVQSPGKMRSAATPATVSLTAATVSASATAHQQDPAMTKTSAPATVGLCARRRQVTTPTTTNTTAATE